MRSKAASLACMPRLTKGRCRASTAQPAASVSLLDRIRDAVVRLIMLTAVSKASVQRSSSSGRRTSSPRAGRDAAAVAVTCRRDDSIRNEAVEECIEFLKRSSAEGEAVKLSSVTAEAVAAAVASENEPEPKRLSSVVAVAVVESAPHAHAAAVAAAVASEDKPKPKPLSSVVAVSVAESAAHAHAAVVAGVEETAPSASASTV